MTVQPSNWTLQSLHDHLLEIIKSYDRRYDERFQAQQDALAKADRAAEKHFELINGYQKVLDKQQQTLITRSEVDIRLQALADKQYLLSSKANSHTAVGRGKSEMWGYMVGVMGLIMMIISIIVAITK